MGHQCFRLAESIESVEFLPILQDAVDGRRTRKTIGIGLDRRLLYLEVVSILVADLKARVPRLKHTLKRVGFHTNPRAHEMQSDLQQDRPMREAVRQNI